MKYKCKKIAACCLAVWLQLTVVPAFCQQVKRPPINGIAYVQLAVSNLRAADTFYHGLLGYTSTVDKQKNVRLQVNFRQSIQLQATLLPQQDERLLCLAFQTTDAAAMHSYLQQKNISVSAVERDAAGNAWCSLQDPDKHPLRFIQYAANGGPQTPLPRINPLSARILHAGLTITDTAAASRFYRDVLGFAEIWRGGATDSITSWINMRVPEGTDYLEYMLVQGPVSRQQLGSLHHIALMVPDMQQAVDELGIRSARIHYPVAAPRVGRNNRWQLNLYDPDGTRIELMEPFTMR